MSGQDRLRQTRGLLLIQSNEGFICKRARNRGGFLIIQPDLPPGAPRTNEENSKLFVSAILAFFFFFIYLEWNRIVWAQNTRFQHATAEGWWVLLCAEKDKDFSSSAVKIQIIENPMYNICNVSGKQKICHALHPPAPSHMQWFPGCNLLIASPFLQWSVILLHPPPHRAAFDFKSWTILQHLLMWFCK